MSILEEIRAKAGRKPFSEEDMIEMHHRFMCVYGWIPLAEFRSLPLPTLWNLLEKVNEEYKEKKETYQAIMALAGAKR